MNTYLCCYDYKTGGIWLLMDASNKDEIKNKYPELTPYDDKPDWMSPEEKLEFIERIEKAKLHWNVKDEPSDWLKVLVDGRNKNV